MMLVRRVVYFVYRGLSGVRDEGPRRLTRAGLGVLGGMGVSGLLSLNIAGSLSYQIFVVLGCLLGTAAVAARCYRMRFAAERQLPRLGTVGEPLAYTVVVWNRTARRQADLVLLENLEDPRPRFEEYVAVQRAEEKRTRSFRVSRRARRQGFELARIREAAVPELAPGVPTEVRMELVPLRRGCLRFAGVTLARPDPLGLVRGYAGLGLAQSLLVLPRRYELPPLALPGQRRYQQGGVALAASVGESEEFVALRDYRPGDPLRHIHWRSWAKAGQPIVKEFEDEFFVRHALFLDTFTDEPQSELFEEAVSVAASFACTLQTQESLLDLLLVGAEAYCFTSGRGVAHTEQMLEVLASVRPCRERAFGTLEQLVLSHLSVVSGCIGVLIGWDAARERFIRRLRDFGVPLLVLVVTESGSGRAPGMALPPEEPGRFHVLEVGKVREGLARLQ
ncbi:MAG: DUF58 domain-containing protein [Verrucomicrobia bacterium]|nr:DUF58 domain-containing protein [Verrucomicrobiota bacterium]